MIKRMWLVLAVSWGVGIAGETLYGQLARESLGYLARREVPPALARMIEKLGSRLEMAGQERVEMVGTLAREGSSPVAVRIYWEFPGRMRVEEKRGERDESTVFDGGKLDKSHGVAGQRDKDLMEMLVHDSMEGFFIAWMRGQAMRFLGSGFRSRNEAGEPEGPDYDLYEMTDHLEVGRERIERTKLYRFDTELALLGGVSYRLQLGTAVTRVDVELSEWGQVDGHAIPGRIVRYENGVAVLELAVREAGVSGKAEDGLFSDP